MALEMKVPSPGESITEVEIAEWLVQDGDYVEKNQVIAEVDSDKATLELTAEESGAITLKAEVGDAVQVGEVVCLIDTDAPAPEKKEEKVAEVKEEVKEEKKEEAPAKKEETKSAPAASGKEVNHPSPAARKLMAENGIPANALKGSGKDGRITKGDVLAALSSGFSMDQGGSWSGTREEDRKKMSSLRRKVAERLVSVKNETAMLTTFNEVNMKPIMDLRKKYKEKFAETHGVGLGFMSFFTKACTEALKHFPAVNGMIDGEEMIYHEYVDMGIAVSSPKGLMVPVLRNAEMMSLAEIESGIKELAGKARDGKLSLEEMTGGTFTITNGGVFGSMMSTPILNPPQSGILGMHNIVERPMAVNGKVEILPMMYVALSYDHRIIDGRESVGFLVKVKQMLEDPAKMLFGSKSPDEILLGL
jgi:2-oxoglutarate dehydrogenase E2 component (dihydrolipoamide succinyltransferase)